MTFIEKRHYYRLLLLGIFILLLLIMVLSSTIGVANISFSEAIRIITNRIPVLGRFVSAEGIDRTYFVIIFKIRLPRIFLSALVGTGLSVVGSTFQGMFKNPMADPYVLGISSGAALGATIAIVAGLEKSFGGLGFITVAAFAGAILTTYVVYNIARVGNRLPAVTLLLGGIAVSFLLSSVISVLMIFNRNRIEAIVLWIMGSVSAADWKQVGVLLPVVAAGSVLISFFSRDLNVMATGEESARSLGIDIENVKKILLVISSVIVAACVSVSGIIGFAGLIIPHMVRLLTGSDHRVVIPFSAISGAVFMVIADTLARSLAPPAELPVGAITSIFGAPFFIYLLIKSKRKVI